MSKPFSLVIETLNAAQGRYRVFEKGRKQYASEIHFTPDEKFIRTLERLHARGVHRYVTFVEMEQGSTYIGEQLFNLFFVGDADEQYQAYTHNNETLRIALHLPDELYYLPWEVLRDPGDPPGQFLAIRGSIIRYDGGADFNDMLYQPENKLTFFVIIASPSAKPVGTFTPKDSAPIWLNSVEPATFENFRKRVRKKKDSGFIFFGHGDVIDEKQGVLYFVKKEGIPFLERYVADPVDGFSVGNAIIPGSSMRLAWLFACESAWNAKKVDFQNSIVGAILKRTRLAFVIGAQTRIGDHCSQIFLSKLLQEIDCGEPLDRAMSVARSQVYDIQPGEGTAARAYSRHDWWVPVLYARAENFSLLRHDRDNDSLPTVERGTQPPRSPVPGISIFDMAKAAVKTVKDTIGESYPLPPLESGP